MCVFGVCRDKGMLAAVCYIEWRDQGVLLLLLLLLRGLLLLLLLLRGL